MSWRVHRLTVLVELGRRDEAYAETERLIAESGDDFHDVMVLLGGGIDQDDQFVIGSPESFRRLLARCDALFPPADLPREYLMILTGALARAHRAAGNSARAQELVQSIVAMNQPKTDACADGACTIEPAADCEPRLTSGS